MYITNVGDLVEELRPRLREYLTLIVGPEASHNKFKCYVHKDIDPSMMYISKQDDAVVHCFGCGITHNIFAACNELEGYPSSGPEWITQTLPHLAQLLKINIRLGEPTEEDIKRIQLLKLCNDITTVLNSSTIHLDYIEERKWSDNYLTIGSVSIEELKSKLLIMGWTYEQLQESLILETKNHHFFGKDLVTFVIRNPNGAPIGFISRNRIAEPKYINTPETSIYQKGKVLLGLDVALREAKRKGLYIVEGPGDLAAAHRAGIINIAACCGTAFTAEHLALLKKLGINKVFFALDWDKSGIKAIKRILQEELKFAPGVSCFVVEDPKGPKDPGEFLETHSGEEFLALKTIPAFDWVLEHLQDELSTEDLCTHIIPIIASESTAIRRELFTTTLSKVTGISVISIDRDVSAIRDGKTQEKNDRIVSITEKFVRGVRSDPLNITSLLSEFESDVKYIEKEFNNDPIGVNYQLAKYNALQEQRSSQAENGVVGEFTMKFYPQFQKALSDGVTWTDGILAYFGGRANSGKTALVIGLGIDVALHDENAIVIMHVTDDSYSQIEPRIKTNIAEMTRKSDMPILPIGVISNPYSAKTNEIYNRYLEVDTKFKELISNEKLILIDAEDGDTLSPLEMNIKYIRRRHPNKKILVIMDNTHNYMDYPELEQKMRMTKISSQQKSFAGKYRCAVFATAEYRKKTITDMDTIHLPTDDDLADARALSYRPNIIIHVYNDVNDRGQDYAEIFWEDGHEKVITIDGETIDEKLPRLLLVVSKNKISSFKDKLVMDLNKTTVTLKPCDKEQAKKEQKAYIERTEGISVEADPY